MADPYQMLVDNQFSLPAIDAAIQQNRMGKLKMQSAQNAFAQQQRLPMVRQQAVAGDVQAMGELAGIDPELWRQLQADQKAQIAEHSKVLGNIALDVLNAPETERAARWDAYVSNLAGQIPELAQYRGLAGPGLDAELRSTLAEADMIDRLAKQDEEYTLSPGSRRFKGSQMIAEAPFAPRLQGFSPEQDIYETGGDTGALYDRIIGLEGGMDAQGNFRTSPAGALGPAQLMPGTAPEALALAGLPANAPWQTDPEVNLAAGKAYYEKQLADFGDPVLAAAAYNAGPGRVQDAMQQGGNNWLAFMPAETQKYVRNFISSPRVVKKGTPKAPKPGWEGPIVDPPGYPRGTYQRGPDGKMRKVKG